MKTALNEFIEYLEGIKERDNIPNYVITTAKNYLQAEKQQIIDARIDGVSKSLSIPKTFAEKKSEEYYVLTFSDNLG
jgi:hypothetical protein